MIEKSCRVNLNFSSAVCDDIEQHAVESDLVQKEVNNLNLYFTFLSSLPWSELVETIKETHHEKYFSVF